MAKKAGFWSAITSAGAAMFGVRSDKERQQDFSTDSPVPFILAGIILVVGMLLMVAAVVNAVIN